ncbi:MAG TPA: LamG domain-containing protein [Polyangia bacterium]|jgi:hypothetical protein
MRRAAALSLVVAGAGAALACGCGQKVLTVVDPCPDGGIFSSSVGCVPPGLFDDLVGWWQLDDGGGLIAHDASLRGNDGALNGLDPVNAWIPGRAGTGLNVEGNGYVNVPDSASIDSITEQVTMAGWGYLDGTIMDYATIASREEGMTIDQHYHISFDGMEFPTCFLKTDNGNVRLTVQTAAARGTWIHIACTYDGSTGRLYVDGQPISGLGAQGLTGRFVADTTPFILGANGNGPDMGVSERFPGRVDEIMLYRRALSASEIAQLHNGVLFGSGGGDDAGARD